MMSFDSQHDDIIHDAQSDYYGKRLATCSSDRTIRIFDVQNGQQSLADVLKGHDGPVWQVAWSHPKFGPLLASCSYDGKVLIWKENRKKWSVIKEHTVHESSVNSISFAPHEHGLHLACGSSDGKVSILSYNDDGTWSHQAFVSHQIGCNAVSWAPSTVPGSLFNPSNQPKIAEKKIVTGGCDNLVKIWKWNEKDSTWTQEGPSLEGHSDWVRDVAWSPNMGLNNEIIASCSQDKRVLIWTCENNTWKSKELKKDLFGDTVWRVSWSMTGHLLAVSSGDNKVSLWKQKLDGSWEVAAEMDESQFK
ncbi:protein transport protein SEC13 [Rozella allomycis CSF55]|uniref:Protein transport protein SEC13 n=1 Tax=Rozella allomycis (strain CSF55) TaxID=988480 RepID=A0A075AW80_ROZAC|nr:hypothetical protein O9G_000869 [Rozella allomycis CSF55]RKP17410.1 protein transport protein SEC13 [Rozella allomycis CSF55]|eukprot:EPZ32794.1 hypothetical protein O9G_000869 [Rozella allomycis CSF55]